MWGSRTVSFIAFLTIISASWCTGYSYRAFSLSGLRHPERRSSRLQVGSLPDIVSDVDGKSIREGLGGKIVVTGIDGDNDEDEFVLNLLNEQGIWDSVTLVTSDIAKSKKQLLTRSARYSGLLNVLEFEMAESVSPENMKMPLKDASAFIALDVNDW